MEATLEAVKRETRGKNEARRLRAAGKIPAVVYGAQKEGDAGNAGYWYARAGRKAPAASVTLDVEWAAIARELLGR